MKNIHILPTDKPSRLWEDEFGVFRYRNESFFYESGCKWKNIYITNDEEIKLGDWYYNPRTTTILKCNSSNINAVNLFKVKKIILTDNQDLIKDGVQAIDDEFLKWFEQFKKK